MESSTQPILAYRLKYKRNIYVLNQGHTSPMLSYRIKYEYEKYMESCKQLVNIVLSSQV